MHRRDFLKKSAAALSVANLPAYVGQLGDMRKRVGLARAIATDPEVILWDEPTTGLDPVTTETINQMIRSMQASHQEQVAQQRKRVWSALVKGPVS